MTSRNYVFGEKDAEFVLIQPVDDHDLELLENEVKTIKQLTVRSFMLVGFKIDDWNTELSPWTAPPVFGKVPFGSGARKTLDYVLQTLLPEVLGGSAGDKKCIIGGYSLAGLFALWSCYNTEKFCGVAAVSPSVWFPQWIDFAENNVPLAKNIYLSLGDKEEKTKNATMSQVGNAIRRQSEILQSQNITTTLEWNAGNHFQDSDIRTAKGFAWVMKSL